MLASQRSKLILWEIIEPYRIPLELLEKMILPIRNSSTERNIDRHFWPVNSEFRLRASAGSGPGVEVTVLLGFESWFECHLVASVKRNA